VMLFVAGKAVSSPPVLICDKEKRICDLKREIEIMIR
jgi:hypothetical protein